MTSRFAVAIFLMISPPTVGGDGSPVFGSATQPPVRILADRAGGVIVPPLAYR